MIAGSQFGNDSWVRPQQLGTTAQMPQPVVNPIDDDSGLGSGVQTGKANPQYEGEQAPTSWQKGNAYGVLNAETSWVRPSGGKPMPIGKGFGSLLMGGVGSPE